MTTHPDVLIAGAGLAGTLLALELQRLGARVVLADDGRPGASRLSAGLLNPVLGQRFTLDGQMTGLFTTAQRHYRRLESRLEQALFQTLPLIRLFADERERRRWERRREDPRYAPWIVTPSLVDPDEGVTFRGGRLRVTPLLDAARRHLGQRGALLRGRVDDTTLRRLPGGGLGWGRLRPGRVVFCQGSRMGGVAAWRHLPLAPARGDLLTLHSSSPPPPAPLVRGHWLLPEGEDTLLCGATYDPFPLPRPDPRGARRLLGWAATLQPDVRLMRHKAGVRATTPDRLPWLGAHPRHADLFLCNGFGSRGSLLIPEAAERLAAHLLEGAPLPPLWCPDRRQRPRHPLPRPAGG